MKKHNESPKTTWKKVAFVNNYILRGLTQQEALKAAGYSPKNSEAARRALQDPAIRTYLAELMKEQREELLEIYKADREAIVAELCKIAFADLRRVARIENGKLKVVDTDLLTNVEAAAIAEIAQTQQGLRVKFHSKTDALDKLAKIQGLYVEKHEHTGKDGEPLRILFNIPRPGDDEINNPDGASEAGSDEINA